MVGSVPAERSILFHFEVFQEMRDAFQWKLGRLSGNRFLFGAVYKTPAGGLYMVPSKDKGIKGKPLAPVRL